MARRTTSRCMVPPNITAATAHTKPTGTKRRSCRVRQKSAASTAKTASTHKVYRTGRAMCATGRAAHQAARVVIRRSTMPSSRLAPWNSGSSTGTKESTSARIPSRSAGPSSHTTNRLAGTAAPLAAMPCSSKTGKVAKVASTAVCTASTVRSTMARGSGRAVCRLWLWRAA